MHRIRRRTPRAPMALPPWWTRLSAAAKLRLRDRCGGTIRAGPWPLILRCRAGHSRQPGELRPRVCM